jgi:ubiquinone/menaquinone biosynthesis C-methylase UbiE
MLAWRMVADYAIVTGRALLICRTDGSGEQALQQGLLDATDLHITALYPSEELAQAAEARIRRAGLDKRLACKVGEVHALPFERESFNLVSGLGGVPFWKDREKAFVEIHRVLRPGGVALVGGYMPEFLRLSGQALRATTQRSGLPTIRVYEDNGQWVEITKTAEAR